MVKKLLYSKKLKVCKLLVIVLTILLLFGGLVHAESKDMELNELTNYLEIRITELMKYYDIPGVNIALIQEGNIAWVKAYGYADIEQGRKMTTDTYLKVQSISKPITAWGVMKLSEEGLINLDYPVNHYIRGWSSQNPELYNEITVKQLLIHNSGLHIGDVMSQYSPTDKVPSLRENLTEEAHHIKKPGDSFIYSNVGYNLLELLIEEVTGLDFETYMQKEVLGPLGMNSSTFVWSEQLYPEVPFGYNTKGEPVPVYVYPGKASGGLISSVEDIAAFVSAGMGENPVLDQKRIDKLYTTRIEIEGVYSNISQWYGLGYFIEQVSEDFQAVWHGGQGNGLMTHFHAVPETGSGIVILTNSQRSWPFIAHILSDWADWNEFEEVGMSNILRAKKVVQIVIILLSSILFYLAIHILCDVVKGRRKFEPFAKKSRKKRFVLSGIFIGIIGVLGWSNMQDYLFITSVFPKLSSWLAVFLLSIGLVSLISACLPKQR